MSGPAPALSLGTRTYPAFASCDAILNRALARDGTLAELWHRDKGRSASLLPVLALLAGGRGVAGASAWRANLGSWTGLAAKDLSMARKTLSDRNFFAFAPSARRGLWTFAATGRFATASRLGFRFTGCWIASGDWQALSSRARHMLLCLTALASSRKWIDGYTRILGEEGLADDVLRWLETMGDVLVHDDLFDGAKEVLTASRVGVEDLNTLETVTGLPSEECVHLLKALSSGERPFLRWTSTTLADVVAYCLLFEAQRHATPS